MGAFSEGFTLGSGYSISLDCFMQVVRLDTNEAHYERNTCLSGYRKLC
jgi:hypothetical protein